jgi:hypothetical protein
VLPDSPFAAEEFGRRRELDVAGFKTNVISREDLILPKLLWQRLSLGGAAAGHSAPTARWSIFAAGPATLVSLPIWKRS